MEENGPTIESVLLVLRGISELRFHQSWARRTLCCDQHQPKGDPTPADCVILTSMTGGALVQASTYLGIDKKLVRMGTFVNGRHLPVVGEWKETRYPIHYQGKFVEYGKFWDFLPWSTNVEILFDSDLLDRQELLMLASIAGDRVGIGAWRPASLQGGPFGRFETEITLDVT